MSDGDIKIAVDPRYANDLTDHQKEELVRCAYSFRHYLNYWRYLDQETKTVRTLGEEIWEGQDQIIEATESVDWYFNLKARKLGATTIEIAYDAWVARFRDTNARVHLFSRREDAAKELLAAVKKGLKSMPPWMQLPYMSSPSLELQMYAGEEDTRIVKSYPTSEETAVEATCTHGHVDEWARMKNPEAVWQAIEPSMAGTCHILTTGKGPINFASIYYKKCLAGETKTVPIFLDALQRPDRDWAWLERKKKGMTEEAFRQEFPMTWEDAMYAGGTFKFRYSDIEIAGRGVGPQAPIEGHRYVKAWDIGRHYDAAVGVVIDVTATPMQVVEYVHLKGVPYPALQKRIVRVHDMYPRGATIIEKNNAGEAVAENLEGIRESELVLFDTGPRSKARIIEELQLALEGQDIQWSATAWPGLDNEVRGYQIPDDNIVQDSVIALAIGVANAAVGYSTGRVGKILKW